VRGATATLNTDTGCDEWDVRTLLNHMLDTQRFFVGSARGQKASPPSPTPPNLLTDDPAADFERARAETVATFGEPGVIEKTGPSLGIAFSDQLLHSWDLAKAAVIRSINATAPSRPVAVLAQMRYTEGDDFHVDVVDREYAGSSCWAASVQGEAHA
jgi:Mycothiol maleylpyruvate isomerase N-terminal domain